LVSRKTIPINRRRDAFVGGQFVVVAAPEAHAQIALEVFGGHQVAAFLALGNRPCGTAAAGEADASNAAASPDSFGTTGVALL
jgi:hypothetical protein